MTETLVAVSPPAPEKNEEPAPVALEQAVPHGEAFPVLGRTGS